MGKLLPGGAQSSTLPVGLFAVSQITTTPWTFEQDVEQYAQLGVALELWEHKLDAHRIAEQMALIMHYGLVVTSFQPTILTIFPNIAHPEPHDPYERLKLMRRAIKRIAPYIPPGMPLVTNTGALSNGNTAEVWAVSVRLYRELADYARDAHMRIALEPLNATMMNRNSILWLLPQALRMVEEVNRTNFGLCVDTYNIWQDAAIADHIRACADRIFLVHVSDWRLPRSFHDRYIIGQGEIPLASLIRALHDTGYRGPYILEIFSQDVPDSLWRPELLPQVIQESRAGFQAAWHAAFAPPLPLSIRQ